MHIRKIGIIFFSVVVTLTLQAGELRRYVLKIDTCKVNLSGKKVVDFALCVNGVIPAPVLEFTEGDIAEIKVINELNEETSVHWHGILLPNEMDGVSYVTTLPIKAKSEYLFKFPIRQSGTYWYHSHTGLQEQRGIYGALVLHPKIKPSVKVDKEYVAILSDWTDENPSQVLSHLKKDGDYYRFKKNRIPSWWDAWQKDSLSDLWRSEWTRMGAMDLSDVGYDRFLINGKSSDKIDLKPGAKLRLRLINAGASTYFYIQVGQRPFTVMASDGIDVKPVKVKEFLIGMGETYDLLVTGVPGKNLELRATAQDVSGYTSLHIGEGELESPAPKLLPNLYKMEHGHGASHAAHEASGSTDHVAQVTDLHHGHHHAPDKPVSEPEIHDVLSVDLLMPIHRPYYASR